MPRVLITRPIPQAGLELLFPAVEVVPCERALTPAELAVRAEGCSAILCQLTDRIDEAILSIPGLRVLATMSAGIDHVDLPAARRSGVTVTHTPGVLTEATAELTWGLILGASRRIGEAERFLRAGRFRGWDPMLMTGPSVAGKTLGILGAGRIGQEVIRMASGFRMKTMYVSRASKPDFERETGTRRVGLEELAAEADVISIHAPLTAETRHLVDAAFLARMKPTAILVNTSRGQIVDEGALVAALASRTIGAAGLDVFENEPSVHPGLLELENVMLLPHIGSATVETRSRMAVLAAQSVLDVLAGRPPQHPA